MRAYAHPDLTDEELAARLDVDEATVADVLAEHDGTELVEAAAATNWDDPDACPFCGARLPDGGPGFVNHIEEREACRLGFERWRENAAGDIGGEWTG